MIEQLVRRGGEVAAVLSNLDFVRVVSHNDADGLAAAGVVCNALLRSDIRFYTTIVSQLDSSALDLINRTPEDCTVILCDMGSGQQEIISKISRKIIIIDHHIPVGQHTHTHINPHLFGIDGASELSASGTAYLVAREMHPSNIDLAGLALTGAIGDKQSMTGGNKFILDEAVEKKVIAIKKGLRVGFGNIEDILEQSTDPYLDISGDRARVQEFLDRIDVRGNIEEMDDDKLRRLASAIALKLMKRAGVSTIESLIGDIFILNREVIPNVFDLVNILNACGKLEKSSLGIALCMRDPGVIEECREITRGNQLNIISLIKKAESFVREGANIRYAIMKDAEGTGAIAGAMTRYLYPDRPFIILNEAEGKIKVSARGTRKLVASGLDLAYVMREASAKVGGAGGGHNIASGATIPPGREEEFIAIADEIVGHQLAAKSVSS